VKVIEARDIKDQNRICEPFVTGKLNSHEHFHKKSTRYLSGVDWWEQTFRFRIKNIEADYVAIEVREKGMHVIGSDWIGEVALKVRDFKDGEVKENWYKLDNTYASMKVHRRKPRGYIHLMIELKHNKFERPFIDEPKQQRLTFDEWKQGGMQMPGLVSKNKPPTAAVTEEKEDGPEKYPQTFETIEEAGAVISKEAWKILMTEHPTPKEFAEMKRLNRVNCLHKGNFDACRGKRYLVCIDGTNSSKEGFRNCLKLIDPDKDHLFIITVREMLGDEFYEENNRVLLEQKLWRAAAGIIQSYQDELERRYEGKLQYTSVMPAAVDARQLVCAFAKKYKIDALVVGKHKVGEIRHHSKHFRSFQRYCQGHAGCTVVTF